MTMGGNGSGETPRSRRLIRLFSSRVHGNAATATAALRILTGLTFVVFSLPKFVRHEDELAEFIRYGFPGLFHLGVAPLLLLSMVYLLWAGSGTASIDRALSERLAPTQDRGRNITQQ
jgi:hypothetical protein